MTGKDWENLIKFFGSVIIAALPFIFWDNIDDVFETYFWIRFIVFPCVAILGTCLIIIMVKLAQGSRQIHWAIWALLGLYVILAIIFNLLQISYFAETWHWSAWLIGVIIWATLSFAILALQRKCLPQQ